MQRKRRLILSGRNPLIPREQQKTPMNIDQYARVLLTLITICLVINLLQSNGVVPKYKSAPIDVIVVNDSFDVNVANSSLDVNVENDSLDVNVANDSLNVYVVNANKIRSVPDSAVVRCPCCNGQGRITHINSDYGVNSIREQECPRCKGAKLVIVGD